MPFRREHRRLAQREARRDERAKESARRRQGPAATSSPAVASPGCSRWVGRDGERRIRGRRSTSWPASQRPRRTVLTERLDSNTSPPHSDPAAGNGAAHAKDLRRWLEALVDEHGLHAQIGAARPVGEHPTLRAELLRLKIADVRRLQLEQGSFELVYWHDARAGIVDRAGQHADRWQQDQQNEQLPGVASR